MIDYIKTKMLTSVNNIDWNLSVNEGTGAIANVQTAIYEDLRFIRKGEKIFLRGSLHKYHNNGQHNYNDFRYCDLANVIQELTQRFGINPETTYLENVEFGVNIKLSYRPERVLNSVILHKGQPFERFNYGNGVECSHAQFYIKIYDKGTQYKQPDNILRIEMKVVKMAQFQNQGIVLQTLSDLLNTDILQKMADLLIRTIAETLIVDSALFTASIPEGDKFTIANGANPNYWLTVKPESKNYTSGNMNPEYRKQRKNYYRKIEQLEKTLHRYDTGMKTQLLAQIRDKFTDLLQPETNEKGDKFTDIDKVNLIDVKQVQGTNLPCSYTVKLSHVRKCPITGLDISMQKTASKFLSVSGIKFYYENEPTIFMELKKRLSQRWQNAPIEIQFKEIAHSVRNEGQNPRHNYQRDRQKRGGQLFDDRPFFGHKLQISMELKNLG